MFPLSRFTRSNAPTQSKTGPDSAPEQRQSVRRPTFSFVEICSEDGKVLIDATIREISAFGAQLRLKSARRLPDRLIIRSQPDRTCNPATLKWMSGVSIGIRFDNEVKLPKEQPNTGERIRIVESHLFGIDEP